MKIPKKEPKFKQVHYITCKPDEFNSKLKKLKKIRKVPDGDLVGMATVVAGNSVVVAASIVLVVIHPGGMAAPLGGHGAIAVKALGLTRTISRVLLAATVGRRLQPTPPALRFVLTS